ncbi:GyrI-like domain-containing protein [Ruminococcaceae bacterium OttesenSCG-928-I18]|nr:GyrI-like domain-containing protein [Ruminococcaceae bacterium OttesenSCG-928-I18]
MDKSPKFDFKKEFPDLYRPKTNPSLVEVPPMPFFMVDGVGAPEGREYQQALNLLYSLTFTVKMSKMGTTQPKGYFDYVVPPLEGLWQGGELFSGNPNREQWRWTSLIRQPDFVTAEVFDWAKETASRKKPDLPFEKVRFETYEEGLCIQLLHIGPYAQEDRSLALLRNFAEKNGFIQDFSPTRHHHEIYLGDPRKTKPERLKTILRHPVKRDN